MSELREVLQRHVDAGRVAGAVGLVARDGRRTVEAVGTQDAVGDVAMTSGSIFRIASVTKLVTAAAVMMLIDDRLVGLDDPISRWLPELSDPVVVRTPSSPIDDVVPAARSITVYDVLTSRAGWGFPSDFSLPALTALFERLKSGPMSAAVPPPDDWLAILAQIPMLAQPGEAWLYNVCSDIQGVLVARVSGTALPEFLEERIFAPLGMSDTGFAVPPSKVERFTSYYRTNPDGGLELIDAPGGEWSSMPAFASGAGGLVSTIDDLYEFAALLRDQGGQLLSTEAVRQMSTDHLTGEQRAAGALFLEGQGWGFGGSVDVAAIDPWNVPGRYGWVGGTQTALHVEPVSGRVTIVLSQLALEGPTPPALLRDFWRSARDY